MSSDGAPQQSQGENFDIMTMVPPSDELQNEVLWMQDLFAEANSNAVIRSDKYVFMAVKRKDESGDGNLWVVFEPISVGYKYAVTPKSPIRWKPQVDPRAD